jgi:hypothetical protein
MTTMFKPPLVIAATLSLTGCVTTAETAANDRAYCERMEREMGVDHRHDHAEAKGRRESDERHPCVMSTNVGYEMTLA